MIPKIIHYIWVGGKPLPKFAEKCIESWKKYCPDYEIKRWDESNLDIEKYKFVKDAYEAKKYAFASDVLRCEILYNYGGIYLDVDVELIKALDDLLKNKSFGGIESSLSIAPGLIWACEKGDKNIEDILKIYEKIDFKIENVNSLIIGDIFTEYFMKKGFVKENKTQDLGDAVIYASEYFSPINTITNKKKITKNTYSIHWYNASWYDSKQRFKNKVKKILNFCTFGLFGKSLQRIRKRKEKNG